MPWSRGPGFTLLFLLLLSNLAAATTVDISYSRRQVPNYGPPPWGMLEGSIIATFTADNPISLATDDGTIWRTGDNSFVHVFEWDWPGPKAVDFVDAEQETISVVAWPQPLFPFDPLAHTVPVVHIQCDSTALWDPVDGIYVWGTRENCLQSGEDWERPATLDYYAADGTLHFTEDVDIRIGGQWSRRYDQKGFRIYFDENGPSDQIVYNFFGSSPMSFRRLFLRSARVTERMLDSVVMEEIFGELGHISSRYAFIAAYLNREYWGVYCLRESIDKEFVEHTWDLADSGDYILIDDGLPDQGDDGLWWDFLATFDEDIDHASHARFLEISSQLDLVSFIDWALLNIFGASADNGTTHNVTVFKPGDNKWQFVIWDEDAAFQEPNLEDDFFRFWSADTETDWNATRPVAFYQEYSDNSNRYFRMFNRLLRNSEFKALFEDRADFLFGSLLSPLALEARINTFVAEQGPETSFHFENWDGVPTSTYYGYAQSVIDFCEARHPIVTTQYAAFMDSLRVPVELTRFTAVADTCGIDLSWRTEAETDNRGFILYRSEGTPDNMVEIASYLTDMPLVGQLDADDVTEYTWRDDTAVTSVNNYYQLHHVGLDDTLRVHNWIETAWSTTLPSLAINEVMAHNITGLADMSSGTAEYDDWFEVHNATAATVCLDSFYITDDLANLTRHQLSGGLTIPADGHLILWADDQLLQQGPAHCPFRLSRDGDVLGLVAPDGVTLLSHVTFTDQFEDISYARWPNSDGPWDFVADPTPGAPNIEPANETWLVLNEFMPRNTTTLADEAGDFDPWLELYNPLPIPVDLSGLSLTNDETTPGLWSLPSQFLFSRSHLLVWTDDEPSEGPAHATFETGPEGGYLGLYDASGGLIDETIFGSLADDEVLLRRPDGGVDWSISEIATPGTPNPTINPAPLLFINEFLASNDNFAWDESGDYDDWVEIYNGDSVAVDIGGLFLTDDLEESRKWELPHVTLPPNTFVLIWCDDEPEEGERHATFKLSASGEQIGLYDTWTNGHSLIDSHIFGPQTTDVSEGRTLDGGAGWQLFTEPTPRRTNDPAAVGDAPPTLFGLRRCYPNPFNPQTTVTFDLARRGHADLSVYDLRGRRMITLLNEAREAGPHAVTWHGRNENGAALSSGTYIVRLVTRDGRYVERVTLVR